MPVKNQQTAINDNDENDKPIVNFYLELGKSSKKDIYDYIINYYIIYNSYL